MKRLGLISCIIGLFLGHTSSVFAQEATPTPDICNISAPESCFSVRNYDNGPDQHFKREGVIPSHCPTLGTRGLSTKEDPFLLIFKALSIKEDNSLSKMEALQIKLEKEDACGNKTCVPINESIKEYPEKKDGEPSVICSLKNFHDQKYGVCTKEAVRRYLAWNKVTNCNKAPTLTITAPTETIVGEEINAKITASGGKIYEWDDENAFITKPVNENPVLENLSLLPSNNNVYTEFPTDITLNTDIPLTFSSTGITSLSATGNVVGKPNLKSPSNKTQITIISSPNQEKPNNELGCNQLLPKYLVGASCNTELKGDARDITYWLQKFSGQITTFIAAIAVLLIAWNAFGLVMASGDSDQIANGKKALMWVGIGLLLTVFAYVIVKTALSLTFLQ